MARETSARDLADLGDELFEDLASPLSEAERQEQLRRAIACGGELAHGPARTSVQHDLVRLPHGRHGLHEYEIAA